MGGKLEIESKLGEGTKITISLKKENPPNWFVDELHLNENQIIIATDDDKSVLEIYKQRFSSQIQSEEIVFIPFTSGESLRNWILENPEKAQNALFLNDFELLGQKINGLDLAEEFNLKERCILVTSRFDELEIRDRCHKLGVRLIPKGMVSFIPISLNKHKLKLDAVILDDDPIQKLMWEFSAKEKKKNILFFSNPNELLKSIDTIYKNTNIYIDSNLDFGIKGEDIGLELKKMGFTNLFLATGYEKENFSHLDYFIDIVGKEPQL
jgi:hypothetical protein